MINRKSAIIGIITNFAVLFFMLILFFTGLLKSIETKAYDNRCRFSSKYIECSDEIGVVILDQDSLNWASSVKGWSWPWPREAYGEMVKYFNRGNAAALTFDMIYSEPSVYGPQDDQAFADACSDFGKVVQTVHYKTHDSVVGTYPVKVLKESANTIGCVSTYFDKADKLQRRNLFYTTAGNGEPVLSIAALTVDDNLPDFNSIPLAKDGGMYIRYVDSIYRFIPYTAKEILISEELLEQAEVTGSEIDDEDFIPPEQFEGNYVFFALNTPGLFDIVGTPIDSSYPGVLVHLCQLNSILMDNYIKDCPLAVTLLILVISIISGYFLAKSTSQGKISSLIRRTAIAFGIMAIYILTNYFIYLKGLILPLALPLIGFALSYITVIFQAYLTEGRQKKFIKTAFSQYLSPKVIDNLIEHPELLNLGGEEREITAYFSDVQGFTSISEKLTPGQLTDLLNKYLSAMTDIILDFGGTIDKYEGDAIIAFWGAPSNQPDHAKRAVEAALACQAKLKEMGPELSEFCGKPFVQRIGLNTGKAVVGNMGSSVRFDYTMMGDTVNLASRLEGINKQFGTYTMCSEATMVSASEHQVNCKFRPIANIAVVGKQTGVKTFVPMTEEVFSETQEIRSIFDKGYDLFVKGDFDEAEKIFQSNAAADIVSAKFIDKCENIKKNPSLKESWDGILKATEK